MIIIYTHLPYDLLYDSLDVVICDVRMLQNVLQLILKNYSVLRKIKNEEQKLSVVCANHSETIYLTLSIPTACLMPKHSKWSSAFKYCLINLKK